MNKSLYMKCFTKVHMYKFTTGTSPEWNLLDLIRDLHRVPIKKNLKRFPKIVRSSLLIVLTFVTKRLKVTVRKLYHSVISDRTPIIPVIKNDETLHLPFTKEVRKDPQAAVSPFPKRLSSRRRPSSAAPCLAPTKRSRTSTSKRTESRL